MGLVLVPWRGAKTSIGDLTGEKKRLWGTMGSVWVTEWLFLALLQLFFFFFPIWVIKGRVWGEVFGASAVCWLCRLEGLETLPLVGNVSLNWVAYISLQLTLMFGWLSLRFPLCYAFHGCYFFAFTFCQYLSFHSLFVIPLQCCRLLLTVKDLCWLVFIITHECLWISFVTSTISFWFPS